MEYLCTVNTRLSKFNITSINQQAFYIYSFLKNKLHAYFMKTWNMDAMNDYMLQVWHFIISA